ncbi:11405_t:CDS:2 [Ambispora leptoticha]|uniref:11405_t:CDS:1 n=1 Tax=Ambispora leptoticha TaxID=144679 RepID=A0A9N9D0J8_9GLOM|nr:11405_t:CDS:2 [Ambispora leptoticha]
MSDIESITTDNTNEQETKNIGGRSHTSIWHFFLEGAERDKDHYEATCLACHSADEICQILKTADLYDEEEDIDLDQVMLNVNLERSNIDDDSEILEDQVLKLQDMINLDISHLNQPVSDETDVKNPQEDNNELDEWMVDLEQEEDYDPKTVANLFVNQE